MFYPERKDINHETMKQFVRDNFSQYAWKSIVLENSCGPIPKKSKSKSPRTPSVSPPSTPPPPLEVTSLPKS